MTRSRSPARLRRAIGSAPARLVCGHRAHDVDGLLNYATRGLSNEPLPNVDFQVELRLEPVKKKYQAELGSARLLAGFLLREVQVDNPRFDRALSDVAYSLVDEATAFVHDLDKVRLDGTLDSAKNLINVRFDLKFAGQKSWLVQASTETLAMVEPAPDLFWQMPADSTPSRASAWAGSQARLKPIGQTLAELVDGYLESEKVPAGLREQASKSIELLFEQNTKQVRAQGELSELPNDPLLAADYRVFGWQIDVLEGEPKGLLTLFDGLSATLSSRDLARLLKARVNLDAALLPKVSSHAVQVRGFKPGAKAYRLDIPRELFEKYAKGQAHDRARDERQSARQERAAVADRRVRRRAQLGWRVPGREGHDQAPRVAEGSASAGAAHSGRARSAEGHAARRWRLPHAWRASPGKWLRWARAARTRRS